MELVQLHNRTAFENNPRAYRELPVEGDPLGPVGAYMGAYCAGMRDRASVSDVLETLRQEPTVECDVNPTIRWLLGSLPVFGAMTLVTRCGIPVGRVADHVRMHGIFRPKLINWLNQFASPSASDSHEQVPESGRSHAKAQCEQESSHPTLKT